MPSPATTLEADLIVIETQEHLLQLRSFNANDAWTLGNLLRALALEASQPASLGIWLDDQTLFLAGTNGITPSNEEWMRRKRNTVRRFGQSSLRIGLDLTRSDSTLGSKHGLSSADFVAHGGGFPLLLRDTGCVGSVVVSGLPQREDHTLVVHALSEFLTISVPHIA